MPAAKAGVPCTIVPPQEPEEALDADEADPGKVEETKQAQREAKKGKYGAVQVKPFKKQTAEEAAQEQSSGQKTKKSWVGLKLTDADNKPVPGEPYEVTLPDGSVASGSTDAEGVAKVQGFDPGQCKVTFPKLDKTVWKPK